MVMTTMSSTRVKARNFLLIPLEWGGSDEGVGGVLVFGVGIGGEVRI
jgi:hypothetical protein